MGLAMEVVVAPQMDAVRAAPTARTRAVPATAAPTPDRSRPPPSRRCHCRCPRYRGFAGCLWLADARKTERASHSGAASPPETLTWRPDPLPPCGPPRPATSPPTPGEAAQGCRPSAAPPAGCGGSPPAHCAARTHTATDQARSPRRIALSPRARDTAAYTQVNSHAGMQRLRVPGSARPSRGTRWETVCAGFPDVRQGGSGLCSPQLLQGLGVRCTQLPVVERRAQRRLLRGGPPQLRLTKRLCY
eukprot:COSAG01_NODE_14409_length_1457_cov_35.983800_2_plen_246_part_00